MTLGHLPTIGDKYYTGFDAETFLINDSTALNGYGKATTQGTIEAVYMASAYHTGHVFGFKNSSGNTQPLYKMCVKNQANIIVAARHSNTTDARLIATDIGQLVDTMAYVSIAYPGTLADIDTEVDGTDYNVTGGTTGWGNNSHITIRKQKAYYKHDSLPLPRKDILHQVLQPRAY